MQPRQVILTSKKTTIHPSEARWSQLHEGLCSKSMRSVEAKKSTIVSEPRALDRLMALRSGANGTCRAPIRGSGSRSAFHRVLPCLLAPELGPIPTPRQLTTAPLITGRPRGWPRDRSTRGRSIRAVDAAHACAQRCIRATAITNGQSSRARLGSEVGDKVVVAARRHVRKARAVRLSGKASAECV